MCVYSAFVCVCVCVCVCEMTDGSAKDALYSVFICCSVCIILQAVYCMTCLPQLLVSTFLCSIYNWPELGPPGRVG